MNPGKNTVRMIYIPGNSESVAATNINKLFNLNKSCVSRSLQMYKQLSTKMNKVHCDLLVKQTLTKHCCHAD